MKILFINAIDILSEVETRYANLGLGYLAASLRSAFGKNAFNFKIVDKNIIKHIRDFLPDIVCITSVTQNYNLAKYYAKIAKENGVPVIIGGIHISSLPGSLTSDMDVGCIGEGEETIVELIGLFMKSGNLPKENLRGINGIVYFDQGRIKTTLPRQPISDLDKIPLPARDLLCIHRHSYMFTSRGCPYNCIFCASTKFWNKLRYFSAKYVVNEIKELVERYDVKLISFFDDLFIGSLPRLEEIVSLLEKERFLGKVRFTCSARANLITDEVAGLLKRMHVFSVGMGLESGSDKTLRYLKGGNVSVADNKRAISVLKRHKIAANASFVIGSPRESKEDIMKTYFFIKDNPLSLFDTYLLTPYPGTEIWDYAKTRRLVADDMDWAKLNVNFGVNFKKAVILSEVLTREDIVAIYKKFQSLRLFKNLKNVWFTPQCVDLPGIIIKKCVSLAAAIFGKLCESNAPSSHFKSENGGVA